MEIPQGAAKRPGRLEIAELAQMPERANHSDLNFRRHLGGLLAQSKDVTRIAAAVAVVTTVVREPVVIQTPAAVTRTVIDYH